jgi:hypothetical protein
MGNIISNETGDYVSTVQNDSKTELTSFSKIINDTMLELDLYSGNTNRSEIDYSQTDFLKKRPKDARGNLIDINGLTYTTNEISTGEIEAKLNMDESSLQANKYYNMKRAFCNASSTAPVNIVGVDLPDDSQDFNHKPKMIDDVSFYTAKQAPLGVLNSVQLDNCIKYGDILGRGDQPGVYSINPNSAYFYVNKTKYIDDEGRRSSLALVKVNRQKPIYFSPMALDPANPTQLTPVADLSGSSALINIEYFNSTLIAPLITDVNCIGIYTEINPEYLAPTNPTPSFNSKIRGYPLLVLPYGVTFSRINPNGNICDQFLKFLETERIISYDIKDILTNNESSIIIGTSDQPVSLVVPDENNNPILNANYLLPTNSTPQIPFPNDLNYSIFLKQKKLINPDNITISDLDPRSETLNDYSNKSVYGAVLSNECKLKLDTLLTNSYVKADVTQYSKLSDIYDPSDPDNSEASTFTRGNISSFKLSQDEFNNNITIRAKDTRMESTKLSYGVIKAIQDIKADSIKAVTPDCSNFYNDLCDFYYTNDSVDGITYNTVFNNARTTNNDMSYYMKNLQFLGEHIPDCKCKNSTMVRLDPKNSDMNSDKYYNINKCEYDSRVYGVVNGSDALYGQPGNGEIDTKNNRHTKAEVVSIYNIASRDLNNLKDSNGNTINVNENIKPFRRQIDPAAASDDVGMFEKLFLFAGETGDGRSQTVTINEYKCNLSYNSTISGVGGNVITSGVSLACNFPSGDPDAPKTDITTPSSLSQFDGSFYDSLTQTNIELDGSNDYIINAFSILIYQLKFPTPTFLVDFNTKYAFEFTNENDKSTVNVLADNCNSVSAGQRCEGNIRVKVPFLYGSKDNSLGVKYTIRLKNLTDISLTIPNNLFSTVLIKQYAMKIASVKIVSHNTIKAVSFTFNLNTPEMIPNIPYRIIFTSTTNRPNTTSPHVITVTNTDFFSAVTRIQGPLDIFDQNNPFQNMTYSYQFRICETKTTVNSQTVYSGGYALLYDDNMPIKNRDQIDFKSIKVGFNSFVLQYKDYDNNNVLNMVASNDTIKMGVTMMATWDFFSDDTAYSFINIYYSTNLPNSVKQKLNKGLISIKDPQFYFIFPLFPVSVIVTINACASDKDGNDILLDGVPQYSSIDINLKSADVVQTFRGWKIITDKLFSSSDLVSSNEIKLTNNSNTLSITEYLSYASAKEYLNILFDYTNNTWYYTNNALIPDNDEIISNNYTIFQTLPRPSSFTIEDVTYLDDNGDSVSLFPDTSNISKEGLTIMMGSSLNINWKYTPSSSYDIDIQVKIFNGINGSFTIPAGTTNGTFPIILYDNTGNLNTQTTTIELISYETNIKSTTKTIKNIQTDPGLSTEIDSSRNVSVNVSIPIIFLNNTDKNRAGLINKINLRLTDPLDNKFFVYYQNVADNLSISSFNITLLAVDYSKPLSFIHALKKTETFSNVKFGLRKKYIEHFGDSTTSKINMNKQIHIDVLTFDYSNANSNSLNKLSIMSTFNNYYSVYINTLILDLGSNSLDGYKFDIELIGIYLSNNTKFTVSSVIVIGTLTTNIFFVKALPGLETVTYKDTLGNNTKLVYSNGNYSIPEDFVSAPIEPPVPEPPPSDSGIPMWVIILIVVIILALIAAGVYFMMKNKK